MDIDRYICDCVREAPKGAIYHPDGEAFKAFKTAAQDGVMREALRGRIGSLTRGGGISGTPIDRCFISRRTHALLKAVLGES